MKKVAFIVAIIIVLIGSYVALTMTKTTPQKTSSERMIIGLSLDNLREERWQRDLDLFTARAKELGAEVVYEVANSDPKLQISQAESLILQGVQVMVVIPNDGELAAAIVDKAHAAGVKVIAYDRLIKNSSLDIYVSFDNEKVGVMQATSVLAVAPRGTVAYVGGSPTDNNAFLLKKGSFSVLDPLIKKGSIQIGVEAFSPNWDPDEAYKTVKQYLATGKKLDAVVAANDGTANGAIRALAEYKLQGKVPVSGQDAELSACQRIIEGTQTATVYKPIKSLADKAAELAVLLAQKKPVETNNVVNNGKIDVPSYLIEPVLVTKETMDQTVIKDGFHTREDVYKMK